MSSSFGSCEGPLSLCSISSASAISFSTTISLLSLYIAVYCEYDSCELQCVDVYSDFRNNTQPDKTDVISAVSGLQVGSVCALCIARAMRCMRAMQAAECN